MGKEILEIKNLEKKYTDGFRLKIDYLSLEENKILVVIGPNGSGKSTIIRLINLLEEPDSGIIIFNGINILGEKVNRTSIRKFMSVVFQEPLLFSTSVYNNILMGLNIRKIKLQQRKEIFNFLVKKLRLEKLLARNPRSLSGGEQQRAALARALILEPKLLLLDEPLANIDPILREELRMDIFDILRSIGRSTIYVTHDRNEAMIIADDIAVINEGRVEQFGKKDEIFRKPSSEFVAKFVGVETLIEGIILECRDNVCRVTVKGGNKGDNKNPFYENSDYKNYPYENFDNKDTACKNIYHKSGQNIDFFIVAEAKPGEKVTLAIRPEDVILYNVFMPHDISSAMNLFRGVITDIQDIGIFKKIEIDCGFKLVSFVTQNSIERLGIAAGKNITASIKASSIHMFKR
ncbi:MAG: ABC transporter ATP-binding protein [Actinobacteria bacterium]|nr:ABC transporter ATP-binding protein [Actinomycetota bacterium]